MLEYVFAAKYFANIKYVEDCCIPFVADSVCIWLEYISLLQVQVNKSVESGFSLNVTDVPFLIMQLHVVESEKKCLFHTLIQCNIS